MATSNGNESASERQRKRDAELHRRAMLGVLKRLVALLGSSGIIIILVMVITSSTAPLASAQALGHVTADEFGTGTTAPFVIRQPAGQDAHLLLAVAGSLAFIDIAQTSSAPAHEDPGLALDVTCALSVDSVVGEKIVIVAIEQVLVIDETTGMVIPIGPTGVYIHTDHFWKADQAAIPQPGVLPTNAGITITLASTFARFGTSALPLESYQVTLALRITGAGEVSCSVFAPAEASKSTD